MKIVRELDRKALSGLFIALSIGIVLLSLPATAAPTGSSFSHIVIIAMENQDYGSVIGSSSAPFINSLASLGSTMSNYHSFGQSIGGCSAGCYEAFTAGQQSVSNGWCSRSSSPCVSESNIASQLSTAGLSSAMFCEDGCPRGADHFPWIGYANTWNSCVTGSFTCNGQTGPTGNLLYASSSSNGNSAFINYLNGASPANYIWFTPTDSHNMHDNSVSSGDTYIHQLLVGSGTIANPASGSVLATNLFKSPGTFLYLWWDEYDPSPNVEYGNMIKAGYTSTQSYTEYDSLHTIEANWGLPFITSIVSGDSGMTDIFGTITPPQLSASFVYLPASPIVNTPVSFTATAAGGTLPYTYSWNFGDSNTGTGITTTHTYTSTATYTVTLTVTDGAGGSAKSTKTVQVSPIPALTASFTFTPTQPTTGQSVAFSGTATGGVSPYTQNWNFGDGVTATGQSPTHTYTNSGTYTVGLNITDTAGTHTSTSQSITISPPGVLSASFVSNPTLPASGQTVTFTATATGGTVPYAYSWNLGGTSRSGNPTSLSFTNGTYAIAVTVTDSTSRTATATQTLTVLPSGAASTVPQLVGWGGIRLDEAAVGGGVHLPNAPPASLVFQGESATNMELIVIQMKAMGYNTVRVDFDPSCTGSQYMSAYSATNLQRAIQIAQYFGFWIVIDYHGYSEPFNSSEAPCWLNFWSGVTSQFKNSYSKIIWEPLNEPCYGSSCAGSSTNNDLCSGASSCLPILSQQYQSWIDQTRAQGDTHWIVVQNICSYGCSLSDFGTGFPTVTDPLGTLSQGGKIFISLHTYMGYSSGSWTNSSADSMAQQYYQAVLDGVNTTGWPALNTEGGTDPLCNSCAPDQILSGSAGYTTVTFHFIQALTDLYDQHTPQRINWLWWPAGSWTDTPGAGPAGALQCASTPIGWGCLLNFMSIGPPAPDFTLSASTPSSANIGQSASSTITITAQNGFAGTVALTDNIPTGLTCNTIIPSSLIGSGTATLTCTANSGGTYAITVIGTSSSLIHSAMITFTVKIPDFTITASVPAAIGAGQSTTTTITLTALNGFAGTITLTDSVPNGLICGSMSTTTITGSGSASISCNAVNPGGYTLTITATSGSLTHSRTVTFTFQDFTLSASSPSAVSPGSSTSSTVTLTALNGFSGTISIAVSSSAGLSCNSPSPGTVSGSGTASVSCTSTSQGVYTATMTATSGSLTHAATATFTFGTPPDFTIGASSPSPLNVGSSTSTTITISLINGLTSPVSLTDSVPSGLNCGPMSTTSFSSSGTAIVSCSSLSASTYTLRITGTSGSLTHTVSAVLTFQDFGLTADQSSLAINSGEQGTSTVSLNRLNGFGSQVTLTISTPQALTVSLSRASLTGTQSSTLTASSTTPGSYSIVVSGTSGSLTRTITILVTVGGGIVLPPPAMTVPGAQTANVGKTLQFTISASDQNGGTYPVTLTASGLVKNMAFDPATGVFTFTPDQSQVGQTFNVNFTATYGDNPPVSTTRTVTIKAENSSNTPSGGTCLTCFLATGLSVTVWLLVIGALVGVVSSMSFLNIRAHHALAAAKKSNDQRGNSLTETRKYLTAQVIVPTKRRRRTYVSD